MKFTVPILFANNWSPHIEAAQVLVQLDPTLQKADTKYYINFKVNSLDNEITAPVIYNRMYYRELDQGRSRGITLGQK